MQSIQWLFLALGLWLLLSLSLRFYGRAFQRHVRGPDSRFDAGPFAPQDIVLATALIGWFALNIFAGLRAGPAAIQDGQIASGVIVFLVILAAITFTLKRRGLRLADLFGFNRLAFAPAAGRGLLYLLAAYPLIFAGMLATQAITRAPIDSQSIVNYFRESPGASSRLGVIFLAVMLAPVAEEIIFRGYLYGVVKKFLGPVPALVGTALLFGFVHLHLPSVGVLFILSICLSLAFEATGSLLVPMTMHSLFNAISLSVLLFESRGM